MQKASSKNNYLYNKSLRPFASELRKRMTKSEYLWKSVLRKRPIFNYIADFMCKELLLIIELILANQKKEKRKRLQILSLVLMIPIIGITQEFKCDNSNGNYFKVTAESGLNIRQEPKSNSNKIFTIPFESLVFVCRECSDCQSEIIEGKKAKWKKVHFENYEGFVFGGFLEPEIKFMYPSDWMIEFETPTFRKEIDHFGIYPYRGKFRVKKIIGRDTMIDDPAKGKINMIKLEKGNEPNFIISGVELTDGQIIKGKKQNQMLFIGEAIHFQSSYLFAIGDLEISENNIFPFSKIKDYKLILRQATESGRFKEQTLFTNDFFAWAGGGSYEGGIWIRWIGDIDGDNKMDILLSHATHYACWDVILFLSTKAKKGELVGQAAKYQACGC